MNRTRTKRSRLKVILLPVLLAIGLAGALPGAEPEQPQIPECGVPFLPGLPPDARPSRPTLSGPVSFRSKTNVRVHYTTSGSDATTLAYAESVAVYAESCWARNSRLGWVNPPPDYGAGGDNRFDIYLRHTDNLGAYGVCVPDSINTTHYPDGWCSWNEVCTDSVRQPFPRYARLRALVAHEFHHAVQMAYSRYESPHWAFYENTSVWAEEVLFPGNGTLYWRNREDYTDNPLTRTERNVNTTWSHFEYPGGLWPQFLVEYYGSAAVRRVWDLCGNHVGSHMMKDKDSVLQRHYSSSLHDALGHYALWRFFTGTRDDGKHFARADECTTALLLRTHSTYPASGDQGTAHPRGPGGMKLVQLNTDGNQTLTISFTGQTGHLWRAYVLATRDNVTYEQRIMLNASAQGSITIPAWMITRAVLVPVVVHWYTGDSTETPTRTFSYTVTASTDDDPTGVVGAELKQPALELFAASPVRGPATIRYFLPPGATGTLRVTDPAGRLVREFALTGTGRSAAVVLDRDAVPAGVYFYQLASGGEVLRRKLVLE